MLYGLYVNWREKNIDKIKLDLVESLTLSFSDFCRQTPVGSENAYQNASKCSAAATVATGQVLSNHLYGNLANCYLESEIIKSLAQFSIT